MMFEYKKGRVSDIITGVDTARNKVPEAVCELSGKSSKQPYTGEPANIFV